MNFGFYDEEGLSCIKINEYFNLQLQMWRNAREFV